MNQGRPLVLDNHNDLSASFTALARELAGVEATKKPEKSSGLLGLLAGRKAQDLEPRRSRTEEIEHDRADCTGRYQKCRVSGAEEPHPSGAAEPAEPRSSHAREARGRGTRNPRVDRRDARTRSGQDAAQPVRARVHRQRRAARAVRTGTARRTAERSVDLRHPGESLRPGVRGAARQARAHRRRRSRTSATCSRSSSGS